MATCRVIFFDVGNTLLFPNRERILSPVASERRPTLAQWQALERQIKIEFDQAMKSGGIDYSFWQKFHTRLLREQGFTEDSVCAALVANTQMSANWDQILPGTRESLERLGQHYRLAVISNADGYIDKVLRRCGIVDCFESITDSGIVGREKPHPAIFNAALQAMHVQPEESLYIGDIYSVDYVGARNVGMEAVLLDVSGAYRERGLPRVESLPELENWLPQ
jgi:putative hydrolase of the HAD superfamily